MRILNCMRSERDSHAVKLFSHTLGHLYSTVLDDLCCSIDYMRKRSKERGLKCFFNSGELSLVNKICLKIDFSQTLPFFSNSDHDF